MRATGASKRAAGVQRSAGARGASPARCAIGLALCTACAMAADLHAQLRSRLQVSGFTAPVAFVQDPGDRTVQFVVQQNGRIRAVRGAAALTPDFLDVSSSIV